jgi:hypothetical protein
VAGRFQAGADGAPPFLAAGRPRPFYSLLTPHRPPLCLSRSSLACSAPRGIPQASPDQAGNPAAVPCAAGDRADENSTPTQIRSEHAPMEILTWT